MSAPYTSVHGSPSPPAPPFSPPALVITVPANFLFVEIAIPVWMLAIAAGIAAFFAFWFLCLVCKLCRAWSKIKATKLKLHVQDGKHEWMEDSKAKPLPKSPPKVKPHKVGFPPEGRWDKDKVKEDEMQIVVNNGKLSDIAAKVSTTAAATNKMTQAIASLEGIVTSMASSREAAAPATSSNDDEKTMNKLKQDLCIAIFTATSEATADAVKELDRLQEQRMRPLVTQIQQAITSAVNDAKPAADEVAFFKSAVRNNAASPPPPPQINEAFATTKDEATSGWPCPECAKLSLHPRTLNADGKACYADGKACLVFSCAACGYTSQPQTMRMPGGVALGAAVVVEEASSGSGNDDATMHTPIARPASAAIVGGGPAPPSSPPRVPPPRRDPFNTMIAVSRQREQRSRSSTPQPR